MTVTAKEDRYMKCQSIIADLSACSGAKKQGRGFVRVPVRKLSYD